MDTGKLDRLREFFAKEKDVAAVYLFGSAARCEAGPLSDIDVGILLREGLSPGLDYRLRIIDGLTEILEGPVDVIFLNSASPLLRFQVVKNGKLVFSRSEVARVEFEARAIDEYLDMNRIEEEYVRCLLRR